MSAPRSSADSAPLTVGPRVEAALASARRPADGGRGPGARTGPSWLRAGPPGRARGGFAEASPGSAVTASSDASSSPPISLARTGAMLRSPACSGASGLRPGGLEG